MIYALLFLILFALLFPKALKFLLALMFIGGIVAIGEVHAKPATLNTLLCSDIVGNGWNHMPDVADYIKTQPGSDKLGYGSECNLGSLVFSQCWLEPHWSVTKAINTLLRKAANGEKLPDVPACGA
jgi:hypothetical protein